MEILLESLTQEWHNLLRLMPRIGAAAVVLLMCYGIGRALGSGVVRVLARGNLSPTHTSFFRGLITWVLVLVGFIVGLSIVGLRSLAASLLAGRRWLRTSLSLKSTSGLIHSQKA